MLKKNVCKSTLYIVPTPIGNLQDITFRALLILKQVDIIAAEDTRHTKILLKHYAIDTNQLLSLHNFNEVPRSNFLILKLQKGKSIALVSNAGTPLINDPGYYLIRRCHEVGINIIPLPGACAAIIALSASGLPTNRFCYEGFIPKERACRLNFLHNLTYEERTIILYETPHKLLNSLQDMIVIWGSDRYIVLARELTKTWESIRGMPVGKLLSWIKQNKKRHIGEITLLVAGYKKDVNQLSLNAIHTLKLLMEEFPLKKASALTSSIHNIRKNIIYRHAISSRIKR